MTIAAIPFLRIPAVEPRIPDSVGHFDHWGHHIDQLRLIDRDIPQLLLPQPRKQLRLDPTGMTEFDKERQIAKQFPTFLNVSGILPRTDKRPRELKQNSPEFP